MHNTELEQIWKSHDEKLDKVLAVHKDIAINLSRQELHRQVGRLYLPRWSSVLVGLPYTIVLIAITIIALLADAYLVAVGFGAIALIMILTLGQYFYQIHLLSKIRTDQEVLSAQHHLAQLTLSNFDSLNLAIFQLPFWSVCWISVDALIDSPVVYGGINLLVFLSLSYLAYWLYQQSNSKEKTAPARDFLLSGKDQEVIRKSRAILEQIATYQR